MAELNHIRTLLDDAYVAVQRAGLFQMSRDLASETEDTAIAKLRKLRDALNDAGDDFTETAAGAMLKKMLKTN